MLILSTHGSWRFHADPHDYWRWTNEGLQKIIREASFEVIDLRGVMAPASYAVQLLQDSTMEAIPRFARPAYFGMMQLIVQLTDRLSSAKERRKDACAYVLVAQKS
jgi:hypothetical protein